MARLALSLKLLARGLLFVAIYTVTLRFVHTYPLAMPASQQRIWLALSGGLGIRDPDDLYVYGFAMIDLIIAIVIYTGAIRLWRRYRR